MLNFAFPLSFKYPAKYCVIASLMNPPSFVLYYVYPISFVGAFARSIVISLSISARTGTMFRSLQISREQNIPKLYRAYRRGLSSSALARLSFLP